MVYTCYIFLVHNLNETFDGTICYQMSSHPWISTLLNFPILYFLPIDEFLPIHEFLSIFEFLPSLEFLLIRKRFTISQSPLTFSKIVFYCCITEEVTRNFVIGGTTNALQRKVKLLPWLPDDMRHLSYEQHEDEHSFLMVTTLHLALKMCFKTTVTRDHTGFILYSETCSLESLQWDTIYHIRPLYWK